MAPIGTSPSDDAAWTELPVTRVGYFDPDGYGVPQRWVVGADPTRDAFKFKRADLKPYLDVVDQAVANMKRAADSFKQGTWSTGGIDPAKWDAAIINKHSINKRSKPMALTKKHHYADSDGDWVEISTPRGDPEGTIAHVSTDNDAPGFYVTAAASVPLALNMLGYDRPDLERGACGTRVGGYFAIGAVIRDQIDRDELLATAIAALKSIDFFDQGVAERKAEAAVVKAAEIEAAKERVKVANREIAERLLRKAKGAYQDAIIEAYESDTTPEGAAKLQSALSAYETARRKFEGLPN